MRNLKSSELSALLAGAADDPSSKSTSGREHRCHSRMAVSHPLRFRRFIDIRFRRENPPLYLLRIPIQYTQPKISEYEPRDSRKSVYISGP